MTVDENTTNPDAEIDRLFNEAEGVSGPSQEIPMTAPTPAAPTIQELEFTASGKPIKVKLDDPKLKEWASRGYDAPNRIGELNKKLMTAEERAKQFETPQYQNLKKINEWSLQNPDQWKTLEQMWHEKINAAKTPDGNEIQLPTHITQKIDELSADREARLIKEKEQERQAADHTLETDIKSIREQFPHLDFDAKGEDGKSLVKKVLEHSLQHGIANFKTAFRDYYFDDALKSAQEKGKEQVSNTIQKNSRLGLLGKTPAPNKGNSNAVDLRNVTWEQAHKLALEEAGVG